MNWWRNRLTRRTLLATALAGAAILWAMRELDLDPDMLLSYFWGSLLLVLGVAVPAFLLVLIVKRFRR
ncbi:MAG: hypothetical protein E2O54_14820 [Gammaproteobacteria bacterium]|nr:MAG: hypothetical protein E2O58_08380 [Gammaproteobacteria bacterium]TDJ37675.1 MAG: hypothetical protein E2O54_14820 [Gammaproteobacteria bacterium]